MKLKSGQEIESAVKASQPDFVLDLAHAVVELITALTVVGRAEEAVDVLPVSVRNMFYED